MNKLINLTGKSFGKLLVTGHSHVTKTKHNSSVHHWVCKCKCGNTTIVRGDCLTLKGTMSCGCLRNREGKESKTWKGYEEISATLWRQIKLGAKNRNIFFNLKIKDIWELYLKQDKKCNLSGINLTFPKNALDISSNASLDRIDSSKGYVISNVQWVDKRINFMKTTLKLDEFVDLCYKIVKHSYATKSKL
jgi:hypothetical protein